MGLQNQLSDVSSESFIILTVVLIGKSARYLRSLISTILRAVGVFSSPDHRPHSGSSLYDVVVGSGLAGVILLCEQLNLNRVCSYKNQSGDGGDRFGSDCVVCLSRFADGDAVRMLACRHVFHKDCFDGWIDHLNFSCPLCRAPLVSDERVECTRRRVAGDLLAWFPFQ
ncbi:hypothetical protein C2S51_027899 [Perilla frutescens var. frutescens]|nr:hypothetical protein C2S51_027899 [Perilla frutescens var. frutescens]